MYTQIMFYFCIYILYIENTQTKYKQTYTCTEFVLCMDRTRDHLQNRQVYHPLRQIGQYVITATYK
jgi:hypothetical protein